MKYFSKYYKYRPDRPGTQKIELLVNHEKKIIFNLVNKCGTTTLLNHLPQFGYELINVIKNLSENSLVGRDFVEFDTKKYNIYAFIREPNYRYQVGLFQYLNFHLNIPLNTINTEIERNRIIFDQHTLPQRYFIVSKNVTLIKFDSFNESICKIDYNLKNLPKMWSHKETDKGFVMKLSQGIFNQKIKKTVFNEAFKEDFELYESSLDSYDI